MSDRPRPLLLLPLPVSVRLFTDAVEAAQRAWRTEGGHRRSMTTAHMRSETHGALRVLALYDAPVTGELPPEVHEMVSPADPAGQQASLDELTEQPG